MRRNLERRLEALEADSSVSWAASAEKDFWCAVSNAKGNFGLSDGEMSMADRVARLTPLEHVAWQLKYIGKADLEAVLKLYGRGSPGSEQNCNPTQVLMGWILLLNWIPGD